MDNTMQRYAHNVDEAVALAQTFGDVPVVFEARTFSGGFETYRPDAGQDLRTAAERAFAATGNRILVKPAD